MVKYGNVFLCRTIGKIGGVETFVYEIAKKYNKYDITVLYTEADLKQVRRISKYVRCERLTEPVECEICFMNYQAPRGLVHAKKYVYLAHANYEIEQRDIYTDADEFYGVSKWVADAYERLLKKEGIDKEVKVAYNPLTIEKPKRVLKLLSATRLSKEKGKDRMIILANELMRAGIPFLWLIFTTDLEKINNPNVIYMNPRLDIRDYIPLADYVVQLSDTEGCPYTPMEANALGVPCLFTPVESMREIGIQGYELPFDMKDLPLDKIYNEIPKVDWKPPKDIWDTLLDHTPSTYTPDDSVEIYITKTTEYKGQWNMRDQINIVSKEDAEWFIKNGKARLNDT